MNRTLRRLTALGATAAALAGGSTALAGASPAAMAASIPRCLNSQLTASAFEPTGGGAAGSVYLHLVFHNKSAATCHLYGYPGVSAVGTHGNQLGDAATRDGGTAQYVNIAPGQNAHAVLRYSDVVATDPASAPAHANGFRIYPPGDYYAMYAPYGTTAPTRTGSAYEFLQVSRVAPGR
ncbi:MAG: DUF4232 domain-containing protein [Streptosporangiales bacterium]|jgi:hypothetical protein|nr:DUF4232 domain-containing protein [Streptosporangiales bacterium]